MRFADRSLLFADVKHYSKMVDDNDLKQFLDGVYPRLAGVVKSGRPKYANSWGDGIFCVFEDALAAARCALAIRDFFETFHWSDMRLPDLTVRLALHQGRIYEGKDPLTGRVGVIGRAINHTARIEPVVTPGQIWCTDAMRVALEDHPEFMIDRLGTTELVKGWGEASLYRLRRRNESWHLGEAFNSFLRSCRSGIVPKEQFAQTDEQHPDEVFAAELLVRPIRIKRHNGRTTVTVDRNDVKDVVISTKGKRDLSERHVNHQQERMHREDRNALALVSGHEDAEHSLPLGLPMRWASGGVLSIVTYGKARRKWVPLFFRDIRPYGWNVSLGASQRHCGADQKHIVSESLEQELTDPLLFIRREFLEETIILETAPASGSSSARPLRLGVGAGIRKQTAQFVSDIVQLRKADGLSISFGANLIETTEVQTNTSLEIVPDPGPTHPIDNVLVCPNLLELGIEVVNVLQYELATNNYILDGEILETNIGTSQACKELVRMPVALVSCDYLYNQFMKCPDKLCDTPGAQPSVFTTTPMKPGRDIVLFDWDVQRRLDILTGKKPGVGTEAKRYVEWYDKFGLNFVTERGGKLVPQCENPSRLFTPATYKILRCAFSAISERVFRI